MEKEQQLIARAKSGELSAFEELVKVYEQRIYAFAYRACGSRHDAEAITQEAFQRVYRSIRTLRGEKSFSAFLYRIVLHLCTERARRSRRDAAPPQRPEASAENAMMRGALQDAVRRLPENARQVLLLRDVAGLSYTEIAHMLTLTEHAVRSRLADARRTLCGQLRDAVGTPPAQSEGKTS